KAADVVWPFGLWRRTVNRNGLAALPNTRAGVVLGVALVETLLVVDKEPGPIEAGDALLHLEELDTGSNAVRRAGAELALVIHRRHLRAKVYGCRQCRCCQ